MKNVRSILGLLLCIMASSCYHEDEYLPTNISADSIITQLSASVYTIPADGQSFTYIMAVLPIDAEDTRSTVTFTTTEGTFDNNTKTITQTANIINDNGTNKRIAKVKLTSSNQIQNAEVTATVFNFTKTITVSFTNLPFDSYLSISSTAADVPADGASYTYVNVDQPVSIISDYSSITFTTTAGLFDNGTKTITKSSSTILVNGIYKRTATVRLTSSKSVEIANVEVAIKGTSKNLSINFVKAFPDSIKLSVSAPSITQGYENSILITLNLIRSIGIPSINNDATISVMDANNVIKKSFVNYNTKSDANGQIINRFTMGNDPYKGILIITASGTDISGKVLSDISRIIAQ